MPTFRTISVRLTEDEHAALNGVADHTNSSASDVIRRLIARHAIAHARRDHPWHGAAWRAYNRRGNDTLLSHEPTPQVDSHHRDALEVTS